MWPDLFTPSTAVRQTKPLVSMSTADFIPSSLAPAVAEHVRAHRARGRAAIAACGWWPDLLAAGTVVRQTKPLASRRGESEAQIAARNERESYHYVHGAMSPFVIERGYLASAGEQHHVWAVSGPPGPCMADRHISRPFTRF